MAFASYVLHHTVCGRCEREFIYQVKFRLDPQWYVVAEEKPEPGQVR